MNFFDFHRYLYVPLIAFAEVGGIEKKKYYVIEK